MRQGFMNRDANVAQKFRDKLAEWYGKERADKVRHAEAFEVCEYGRRPSVRMESFTGSRPSKNPSMGSTWVKHGPRFTRYFTPRLPARCAASGAIDKFAAGSKNRLPLEIGPPWMYQYFTLGERRENRRRMRARPVSRYGDRICPGHRHYRTG